MPAHRVNGNSWCHLSHHHSESRVTGLKLPPIVVEPGRNTGIGEVVRVLQVEPLVEPVPKLKRRPVTAPSPRDDVAAPQPTKRKVGS